MKNDEIDNLDKQILNALIKNARTPYAELAKNLSVSPGTIHVRVEKMRQAGYIEGVHIHVNSKRLGYDVCCFIGITLRRAKDYETVLQRLENIDEVLEAYYTIGHHYNIFVKMACHSIDALQQLLIHKIQSIDEIQATETLISLQNPIMRDIRL